MQIEVFCVANLVNCALEADEENIVMDFHYSSVEGGLEVSADALHGSRDARMHRYRPHGCVYAI